MSRFRSLSEQRAAGAVPKPHVISTALRSSAEPKAKSKFVIKKIDTSADSSALGPAADFFEKRLERVLWNRRAVESACCGIKHAVE